MEIKRPLNGIMFTRKLLEGTDLNEEQKQVVQRSLHCETQLLKILDDMDLESIEDGYMELETVEFTLGALLDAVVSQVMIQCEEKGLEIIHDLPEEITTSFLCGDRTRLQQILACFLGIVVQFTSQEGWVAIKVTSSKKQLGGGLHVTHLEFRITHPGQGLPEELLQQMLNPDQNMTQEGFGLFISRKLVKLMNGDVQYLREEGIPSFIIVVEVSSGQNDEA
ncbi:hypothetical protein KI387_021665 [Taxus chinensis]|uniref:histidine kinase n=1 Tax=Taxus chinensis TaxID=29808 RepID=A0AA38LDT4_TAXCH|nr:hypothetical protein KI387_021665 [Taxus chinensis]